MSGTVELTPFPLTDTVTLDSSGSLLAMVSVPVLVPRYVGVNRIETAAMLPGVTSGVVSATNWLLFDVMLDISSVAPPSL